MTEAEKSWPRAIGFIAPLLLWLWLLFHLHYAWGLNAQYNYGWAVPVLAAFLGYLKWSDRPAADAQCEGVGAIASWLLLAALLPLRVIEEANPDWRLLSWALAIVVVAFSLLSLKRAGGNAWAWHFAFPVSFIFVAVPWPVQFENAVVQSLTRLVAFAAVEIAGWVGIGAFQMGNVIELHNGFVGVDEACSGVKTLQAAIMVTLALGELMQLRLSRRIGLLLGGCIWVFVCNVGRATALVMIAAKQGASALAGWHDLIGTVVVILGMAGLVGAGWLLREQQRRPGRSPSLQTVPASAPSLAPLIWLILIFGATEAWYRIHERSLVPLPAWNVRWPNETLAVQDIPIARETREILHYDNAVSAAWEDLATVRWWGFFARWEPKRAALQLVRSHSPEICLPATGRVFRRELSVESVQTDALPLQFRVYEFEQNRQPLFVFVSIQEDKIPQGIVEEESAEWNARGRILAAWRGERNLGQRLLELAVIGLSEERAAREAMRQTVRGLVRAESPKD